MSTATSTAAFGAAAMFGAACTAGLVVPLALALCACAGVPTADAGGPGQPVPAPTETTAPGPAAEVGLGQARAERLTREIMEAVATARALPITGEVKVAVMHRPEIRKYAQDAMYEHHTREQLQLFTRLEASMGVLPLGADGERILLDMLETGVMGLYEPKLRTLVIGTYVTDTQLDMVVGHEIAHGLQDMHFGLQRLQKPIKGDSDAESARTYLVEGDAQAAYLAWVSGERGLASISEAVFLATGNQALDLADLVDYPILARSMQLPYADGAATIAAVVRERGWSAVDALYKDLPTTTEQMLHPAKLLAREAPQLVAIRPEALVAALPGRRLVWEDNIGEASLLTMLADVESSPTARAAATGWGGDRYIALDRSPAELAPVIVGLIAWDSAAEAAEFEPVFRTYLDKVMPGAYHLERRNDQVLFATQLRDAQTRKAVLAHAWGAFTVTAQPAGTRAPAKPTAP
ncbi:MAG: hypothetical protein H0T76_04180 [Nannocystis sp.]|nr:hypothetical protein [Nannocystis sp.]MBA3545659.1 hypothetical protein [Nannocystis sp.]